MTAPHCTHSDSVNAVALAALLSRPVSVCTKFIRDFAKFQKDQGTSVTSDAQESPIQNGTDLGVINAGCEKSNSPTDLPELLGCIRERQELRCGRKSIKKQTTSGALVNATNGLKTSCRGPPN